MLSKVLINCEHPYFELMEKGVGRRARKVEIEMKEGINVIVGINGAGKSTFMQIVRDALLKQQYTDFVNFEFLESFDKDAVKPCYFFKMHDMNPDEQLRQTMPHDLQKIAYHMQCREMSSGQQMMEVLENIEYLGDNSSLIFIDEPEISLDGPNMIELVKKLESLAERGVQVMIISHHPMVVLNNKFNPIQLNGKYDYAEHMRKEMLKMLKITTR